MLVISHAYHRLTSLHKMAAISVWNSSTTCMGVISTDYRSQKIYVHIMPKFKQYIVLKFLCTLLASRLGVSKVSLTNLILLLSG